MPGEAQKIDRLLDAFCVGFCRDNPGIAFTDDFTRCHTMMLTFIGL
jgi:Sec7-like guanine-nucleotide exchange factor